MGARTRETLDNKARCTNARNAERMAGTKGWIFQAGYINVTRVAGNA